MFDKTWRMRRYQNAYMMLHKTYFLKGSLRDVNCREFGIVNLFNTFCMENILYAFITKKKRYGTHCSVS